MKSWRVDPRQSRTWGGGMLACWPDQCSAHSSPPLPSAGPPSLTKPTIRQEGQPLLKLTQTGPQGTEQEEGTVGLRQ